MNADMDDPDGRSHRMGSFHFIEIMHLWVLTILAYEASWVASERVFFGEENFPLDASVAPSCSLEVAYGDAAASRGGMQNTEGREILARTDSDSDESSSLALTNYYSHEIPMGISIYRELLLVKRAAWAVLSYPFQVWLIPSTNSTSIRPLGSNATNSTDGIRIPAPENDPWSTKSNSALSRRCMGSVPDTLNSLSARLVQKCCACFVWCGIVIVSAWGGFFMANTIGRLHTPLPNLKELQFIGLGMVLAMIQIVSLGEYLENFGAESDPDRNSTSTVASRNKLPIPGASTDQKTSMIPQELSIVRILAGDLDQYIMQYTLDVEALRAVFRNHFFHTTDFVFGDVTNEQPNGDSANTTKSVYAFGNDRFRDRYASRLTDPSAASDAKHAKHSQSNTVVAAGKPHTLFGTYWTKYLILSTLACIGIAVIGSDLAPAGSRRRFRKIIVSWVRIVATVVSQVTGGIVLRTMSMSGFLAGMRFIFVRECAVLIFVVTWICMLHTGHTGNRDIIYGRINHLADKKAFAFCFTAFLVADWYKHM